MPVAKRVDPAALTSSEWKRARPHLLAALERADGTHVEADLLDGIARNAFHLWLGDDSAILSEIVNYPRIRAHRLFLAGGDLDEIVAMEPELSAEAVKIGCTRHEFSGRLGWQKSAKSLGYRTICVSMFRSIG